MNAIIRRTFKALDYPKGTKERIELNKDIKTSEYLPSYKYMAIVEKGAEVFESSFVTKKEALAFVNKESEVTKC